MISNIVQGCKRKCVAVGVGEGLCIRLDLRLTSGYRGPETGTARTWTIPLLNHPKLVLDRHFAGVAESVSGAD